MVAGIKDITGASVGDTLVSAEMPDVEQLPVYPSRRSMPACFRCIQAFKTFREALENSCRTMLLFYEPESSDALGFGFRRLLHCTWKLCRSSRA